MSLFLLNCTSLDEPENLNTNEAKHYIEKLAQKYAIPIVVNENIQLTNLTKTDFAELERMFAGLAQIPGSYSMSSDSTGDGGFICTQSLKYNRKRHITRGAENILLSEFSFTPKDMSPYPYILECMATWRSINNGNKVLSATITPTLTYLPSNTSASFQSTITTNDCLWRQGGRDSIIFDGRVYFDIAYTYNDSTIAHVPFDYLGECSNTKGRISWALVYF